MSNTNEIKKSTANRRAVRGSGITGLALELQLVHLQNMAILRDNIQKHTAAMEEHLKSGVLMGTSGSLKVDTILMVGLLEEANKVLNFIVQNDFQSPIAKDLWEFDPNDSLNRDVKNYWSIGSPNTLLSDEGEPFMFYGY